MCRFPAYLHACTHSVPIRSCMHADVCRQQAVDAVDAVDAQQAAAVRHHLDPSSSSPSMRCALDGMHACRGLVDGDKGRACSVATIQTRTRSKSRLSPSLSLLIRNSMESYPQWVRSSSSSRASTSTLAISSAAVAVFLPSTRRGPTTQFIIIITYWRRHGRMSSALPFPAHPRACWASFSRSLLCFASSSDMHMSRELARRHLRSGACWPDRPPLPQCAKEDTWSKSRSNLH